MKIKKIKPGAVIIFGIFFLFLHSFLLSASPADDIILIANPDVSASTLSKDDVKSIFLGEKTKWDGGDKIVFVLLLTEDHEEFLKKFLGTTPMQYRQYWKKMVFTGRARSPKSFKNQEKLLDYIAGTEGAFGYIPQSAFNDKVKKISVK